MAMKELPCSAGKSLTEKRKAAYNKEAAQRGTQTVGFLCCFLVIRQAAKAGYEDSLAAWKKKKFYKIRCGKTTNISEKGGFQDE